MAPYPHFFMTLEPIISTIENSTFYFYHGSKTNDDCKENVLWYVSKVILPIRAGHLKLIKAMSVGRKNKKMVSPLYSRQVYSLNSSCNNHTCTA